MSNLYDVLEVSRKASKEVIDKAYHVLAKKYHPDLQKSEKEKKIAKEKMQEINAAYDILGDEQKRKVYDLKLEQEIEEQKREERERQLEELKNLKQTNTNQTMINNNQIDTKDSSDEGINKLYKEVTNSYKNAYQNYKRNRIREPWTKDRFIGILKSLGIIAIIIAIVWFFPPTNKLIVDFFENNPIFNVLIDLIWKILIGIKNGIIEMFHTDFIM